MGWVTKAPMSECVRRKQVSEFVVDTRARDRFDRQQRYAYDQRCKQNHDNRKPTSAPELEKTAFQRREPTPTNIRENKSNQHRQQYKTRLNQNHLKLADGALSSNWAKEVGPFSIDE